MHDSIHTAETGVFKKSFQLLSPSLLEQKKAMQ